MEMSENEISKKIIGKAIEVHQSLGPGLLVSLLKNGIIRFVNKL